MSKSHEAAGESGPINSSQSRVGWCRLSARFSVIVSACVTLAGAAWLISLLATRQPLHIHWSLQVMLATLAIFVSIFVEHQRQNHWDKPYNKLRDSLSQIRAGEAPIDELNGISGGMETLVLDLQEILRDLKQQKAANSELHNEISKRVAHRTDALERLVGSLRQQATRDGLTGLCNRRMLDQALPEVMEKCRAQQVDLALLMTDIDHFKHLNDTLGHAAGDELLRAIGQIARSTIRDGDIAFRCGGDEFVILLVGCDLKTSMEISQRLMSMTEAYAKTLKLKPCPRLSVGMSLLSELPNATPEMLLQAADKVLYDMKSVRKEKFASASRPPAISA
jgi:diguanylate cyclase (GGDEF)-like protein